MSLTDADKAALREDELFRQSVRKESQAATGLYAKFLAFFDSKLGNWLITSVFVAFVGYVYSEAQDYINRESITRQEKAEKARRDTDTVMKIMPLIHSEQTLQQRLGINLLVNLKNKQGIDPAMAKDITDIIDTIKKDPKASQTYYKVIDSPGAKAMANTPDASPNTPNMPAPTVEPKGKRPDPLPTRVYIQIPSEAQRPKAERLQAELRQARILVPDIEVVGLRVSPLQNQLRYCSDKTDSASLDDVKAALKNSESVQALVLNASLCANVRNNHMELWLAKS